MARRRAPSIRWYEIPREQTEPTPRYQPATHALVTDDGTVLLTGPPKVVAAKAAFFGEWMAVKVVHRDTLKAAA